MTPESLDAVLRIFSRQRPFRPFVIEFMTGQLLRVSHPEAVSRVGPFYVFSGTSIGEHQFFAAGADGPCRVRRCRSLAHPR